MRRQEEARKRRMEHEELIRAQIEEKKRAEQKKIDLEDEPWWVRQDRRKQQAQQNQQQFQQPVQVPQIQPVRDFKSFNFELLFSVLWHFCYLWKVERLELSVSEPVTQRTGVTNRSSEPISNRVVLREIETQTEEVKPQVKIAPQRSIEVPKQDTKAKAALGKVIIFWRNGWNFERRKKICVGQIELYEWT